MSFFAKLHKYYMFDDYFQKNIISCGYSLILMYITMIWFNCQKKFKFIMDPKNDQIFALRNLSTILHIEIFWMWKPISTITLTWNMNDPVLTTMVFSRYGSVSKECMSNMREIYLIFYHSLSTRNYCIMKIFTISGFHMLFIKF